MRDLIQLEAWAYDIVDRVKRGMRIEDDRIEFKREWATDFYGAARRIADLATSARGGEVLWLVVSTRDRIRISTILETLNLRIGFHRYHRLPF